VKRDDEDDPVTVTYRVTHRTEYSYESDVSPSYAELYLLPRDVPGQRCRAAKVVVDPAPEVYRERIDYFGNRVAYLSIHEPHRALTVTVTSVVDVDDRGDDVARLGDRSWEEVRDEVRTSTAPDAVDAVQFVLDSPLVVASATYADYASASFPPGRPLVDAVTHLCSRIHEDFEFKPGSTSVRTPLAEMFTQRRGVCQDFAHLGIACMRSIGLPARYVSGYLETDPPPGRKKLTGADVSHAWLSVPVTATDWLEVDPTNDQRVNHRYVLTAYGRDYSDVPPLSGVIYTEGRTEGLKVSVDVNPMPEQAGLGVW
jgi:transglutaminase-like putative cysteine protease